MKNSNIMLLGGIGLLGFLIYKYETGKGTIMPIPNNPINPNSGLPSSGDYQLQQTHPNYQPQYNPADMLHSALYGGY